MAESAQPFDLITAFWICFNRHRQPDEWGAAEWRYFVEDAIACLRPGGRLVLDLNENAARYGHSPDHEAALCVIHGMLHLAGWDDLTARDAKQMAKLQEQIFKTARKMID